MTPPLRDLSVYGLDDGAWLRRYRQTVRIQPGLSEALNHFRQLFEMAPTAFVVTDPGLIITDANRDAVHLFRRVLGGLRGKPLGVFVSSAERIAFRRIASEVLESEDKVVRPLAIKPKGEAELDVVLSARAMRDEAGEVAFVVWLFRETLALERTALL